MWKTTIFDRMWRQSSLLKSVLGLLLLLIIQVPFRIIRASNPFSFWCDEAYTILISNRSVDDIIRLTSFDAHPPGYYFLMKVWFGICEIFHVDLNALVLRTPCIVSWVILITIAWFAGRNLIGKHGGTLFAWLLAFNAQFAYTTREARNYAPVACALLICFFTLLALNRAEDKEKQSLKYTTTLWSLYTISAIVALWMHLLVAPILFFLGLTWIGMCLYRKKLYSHLVIGGFIANFIAASSFIPWLIRISNQLNYIRTVNVEWMTPPSFTNWISVFIFWLPAGRQTNSSFTYWFTHDSYFRVLVFFTTLPIIFGIASGFSRKKVENENTLALYTAIGIIISLLFVSFGWFFTYFKIAQIFHAPRYPVMIAHMWFFALVCWTQLGIKRFGLKQWWAWIIISPLFLCSYNGESIMKLDENEDFTLFSKELGIRFPQQETTAYFSPSILTPYMHQHFNHFQLNPYSDITKLEHAPEQLIIIKRTDWLTLQEPADRLVSFVLHFGEPAEQMDQIRIPDQKWPLYSIYVLKKTKEDVFQRLKEPFGIRINQPYSNAASTALPENQVYLYGFAGLEISSENKPYCWGGRDQSTIYFDSPIEAGEYILNLNLFRHPFPTEITTMNFSFKGEESVYKQEVRSGVMELSIPITLSKSHTTPALTIEHPTWVPSDYIEGNQDHRELTFLFSEAWLEHDTNTSETD